MVFRRNRNVSLPEQKVLTVCPIGPNGEHMTNPHHEAVRVQSRAFAANLKMPAVLKRAGVGRSTWWRIRNGKDFRASVITRIENTIDEMIAEVPK